MALHLKPKLGSSSFGNTLCSISKRSLFIPRDLSHQSCCERGKPPPSAWNEDFKHGATPKGGTQGWKHQCCPKAFSCPWESHLLAPTRLPQRCSMVKHPPKGDTAELDDAGTHGRPHDPAGITWNLPPLTKGSCFLHMGMGMSGMVPKTRAIKRNLSQESSHLG